VGFFRWSMQIFLIFFPLSTGLRQHGANSPEILKSSTSSPTALSAMELI
jgi:hypothetical protein